MFRLTLTLLLAAPLIAADSSVAQDFNQFAVASYKQLAQSGGNIVFSPINIANALSMAMAGARGDTRREFSAVLHRTDDSAAYDQSIAALAGVLKETGNNAGNVLTQANAIWVQNGFRILPDFANVLSSSYGAPPASLDFAHNAEAARAAINQWTSDHTQGRIAELFPRGSITAQERLVLTAAIYFNGKWQTPFPAASTQPAAFHTEAGAAQETPFMNQTGSFRYAEVPGAQILQLPYAGGSLAFDIILPTETTGLAKIEASMTPENLTSWFAQLANADVKTAMPKFRNEAGFSLNQTLGKMGLAKAFTAAADFSGIDGKHDLSISEVMHRAFLAVDEQGTEAAAATGVAIAVRAVRRPEPKVFRADRPFAYLIRDTASGAILFAGRMAKP